MTVTDNVWDTEPDIVRWTDARTGYRCLILRHTYFGHLVGYVRVPKGHKGYKRTLWNYNSPKYKRMRSLGDLIDIHGGLTFKGQPTRMQSKCKKRSSFKGNWVGFDCAHSCDLSPVYASTHLGHGTYRTIKFVTRQVTSLAAQMFKLR